jgi:hypothetical protein
MPEKVLHFTKEKDTKNTVKYEEQPAAGEPKIIGSLYLQKFFAGDAKEVTVVVKLEK